MTKYPLLVGCLLMVDSSTSLRAQAVPTASPVASPVSAPGTVATISHAPSEGDLSFSFTASELIQSGYEGVSGVSNATNLSGTASFFSSSEVHPLSLVYSGGYLFGNSQGYPSSSFQNLAIAQGLSTRNWRFSIADLVSYLPASPVFGVSGVPGVGDVGTLPINVGNLPTQSILTNFDTRIANAASASADRKITGSTSAYLFGAYGIQRFPNGLGIDNDQVTASGGINHRFDARNSGGLNYTYDRFTYKVRQPQVVSVAGFGSSAFHSHGVNVEFLHTFNRKYSLTLAGGPQWTQGVDVNVISSRVNAAASATLFYVGERTHASATYSRGSNNGSGVLLGSISDNVNASYQRSLGRSWEAGLIANYGRASSLILQNVVQTTTGAFYGGVQATRHIGRSFSAYGSYNGQLQSVNGITVGQNAFSGSANIIGFGATYIPKPIHLGRL